MYFSLNNLESIMKLVKGENYMTFTAILVSQKIMKHLNKAP